MPTSSNFLHSCSEVLFYFLNTLYICVNWQTLDHFPLGLLYVIAQQEATSIKKNHTRADCRFGHYRKYVFPRPTCIGTGTDQALQKIKKSG